MDLDTNISIFNVFATPLMLGLLLMLSVALITDLSSHKIPNKLVLLGLVISFILQVILKEWPGVINWLLGVTLGFIGFLPLYLLRGMAAGDVKLMMAVGGFLGYPLIIPALIYSIILGGVFAIIYTLFKGRLGLLSRNLYDMTIRLFLKSATKVNVGGAIEQHNSAGKMPYALAIAAGVLFAIVFDGHGKIF
ncbi:MAG TPA: prepilin peptidase [Methylophilaceae bacterium]|nr:prepilin peptidase [Methylophilaceae bacterium]